MNKSPSPSQTPGEMRDRSVLMLTQDRRIDRRILLQAETLEADGWKVTILANRAEAESPADGPNIIRIADAQTPGNRRARRQDVAALALYHRIRDILPVNGLALNSLKSTLFGTFIDPTVFLTRLFGPVAADLPARIVVAHDLPMLPVAIKTARRFGAKIVYDSHELYAEQEFGSRLRSIWLAIESKHIDACDAVITVNRSIAGELEKRYGLSGVHVIHNAERTAIEVPGNTRLFHKAFNLPRAARVFLYQGGLIGGRNLITLIDAVRLVRDQTIHLVFMGDGQLRRSLERHTRQSGLADRVHFHKTVPQFDILRYSASADVGLVPYQASCLNNYLCTPNKLFEFIAAALPVIASDLPELRRFIADNDIGELTETGSPDALAKSMDALIGDPARLDRYRERMMLFRRTMNWQSEGEKLKQIFQNLV